MTRRSLRPLLRVILGLMLAVPTAPAQAQTSGSGCPPPSVIEENDQILFARTWLPFRISIEVARLPCRIDDFMVNFFKRQPDPDKASLDDYIEASKPDDGNGGDPTYRSRMRTMPSPTKNPGWNQNPSTSIVVLPPNTSGGVPVLFQANAPGGPTPSSVTEIQGNGTLLSAEGMKRGTFVKGKLNGVGEEIDPNGTWRGGTYESGVNQGYAWEVRKVDGKTYLATGSVVDGKLDGMVKRIFADGSNQYEDWEGGKLMQVGVRAPKGQSAIAPQTRYKPVEEAEFEDAYKKIGPRAKIAPGTTFTAGGRYPTFKPNHPWVVSIMEVMPDVDNYRVGLPLNAMAKVADQCSHLFERNLRDAQTRVPGYSLNRWYRDMAGMVSEVFQLNPQFLQDWVGRNSQNEAQNIEPCFGGKRVAMGAVELTRPQPKAKSNGEVRGGAILDQCNSEFQAMAQYGTANRTEKLRQAMVSIDLMRAADRASLQSSYNSDANYIASHGNGGGTPGMSAVTMFNQCVRRVVINSPGR